MEELGLYSARLIFYFGSDEWFLRALVEALHRSAPGGSSVPYAIHSSHGALVKDAIGGC